METKLCKKCNEFKPLNEIKKRGVKDGVVIYSNICKICDNKRRKLLTKTKLGLINQMFSCSSRRSRKTKYKTLSYSREEFKKWILGHKDFDMLYNNWATSDYNKKLIPSVDRLNEFKGYSFDNIRLVTWEENHKAAMYNKKHGVGMSGLQCKNVVKLSLNGDFIEEYISTSEAGRINNVCSGSISSAILSNHISNGFAWAFAKDYHQNPNKFKKTIYPREKEIYQLNTNGEILSKYNSIKDAMEQTKILNTAICNVLNGRSHTAGNYKWVYCKDY